MAANKIYLVENFLIYANKSWIKIVNKWYGHPPRNFREILDAEIGQRYWITRVPV